MPQTTPPVQQPPIVQTNTKTPAQVPTAPKQPTEEKKSSVTFKAIPTPSPTASAFNPNSVVPALKTGATPSPAASPVAKTKPVLKPSIGIVGKSKETLEAEQKASEAKKAKNSQLVATRKARLAKLTAVGAGGAVVGSQAEIIAAQTDLNSAQTGLATTERENASLRQQIAVSQQQPAPVQQQPSFLGQAVSFVLGIILLILFGAGLTTGALWLAGYKPMESLSKKQLIKRAGEDEKDAE